MLCYFGLRVPVVEAVSSSGRLDVFGKSQQAGPSLSSRVRISISAGNSYLLRSFFKKNILIKAKSTINKYWNA